MSIFAMDQLELFEPNVPEQPKVERKLRPYQQEALERVMACHADFQSALVVHATGLGKTLLATSVAKEYRALGKKVLFVCPTIEITHQSHRAFLEAGLTSAVEQAENRAIRPLPDVVVACAATMTGRRLSRFNSGDFGLVIIDEAHGNVSGRAKALLERFWQAKVLGLTATPDRQDGVALGNIYDVVAHTYTMLDGIHGGYLSKLRFKTAETDFDAKALRTVAGDVSADSVEKEITRSGLVYQAANTLRVLAGGNRTIAFLPTVAASKAFVAELIARDVNAVHIDGTTPREIRKGVFESMRRGDVRVISNVGVLVEGFDLPEVSVIALLNPTKSRARVTQMIGRGTRLAQGKDHCLVIDFCPGRLAKGRLASPADALAGRMLDDQVYDQLPKEGDIEQSIKTAEERAAEEKLRKQIELEQAERDMNVPARLSGLSKPQKLSYRTQEHDADELLGGEPAVGKGGVVDERRERGLCSEKQSKFLAKYGLDPEMDRKRAGVVIGAISRNGYRLPSHIASNPDYRSKP